MRIPLSVENFYSERKVVFAHFFLQIPSMRVAHALSAVVDSGSPFTSIATRDALSLSLPIRSFERETLTYLAGFKFYGKNVKGTLVFRDAENKIVRFVHTIRILIPTKMEDASIREVQDIPSLIGTDFLEDNRLTLVYNPSVLKAYFDTELPTVSVPTP